MGLRKRNSLLDCLLEKFNSHSDTTNTDGFLTISINGEDDGWTQASLTIWFYDSLHPHGFAVGRLTWAYSAQQSFVKGVMTTLPICKGQTYKVSIDPGFNNISKLGINISWTAMIPD